MTDASDRPTVFALHGLGMSARLFDPVGERLRETAEVVALDLPGFGANATTGYTVDEMATGVLRSIRGSGATRWMLAGHSMGGKVAAVVAARALSGREPVFGLAGVVLLAASPVTTEPMAAEQRDRMLGWARTDALAAAARGFIDDNVGSALPAERDRVAVEDVARSAPEAWIAWLERGSREDWAARVGELDLPALLLAGGDDGPLGADAQRTLTASPFPRATVETLPGAGHLLPLERPDEVAEAIRRFWRDRAGIGPAVPAPLARTLASDRTSARVRATLTRRAIADDPDRAPRALTPARLRTLRALAETVVPQSGAPIDLAARVDAQLAAGGGNGWRDAGLPPDAEAYARGLDALDGLAELTHAGRTDRIRSLLAGDGGLAGDGADHDTGGMSAAQLSAWAQDAVDDLARQWLAHPATMSAIGYDGMANGGDGTRQQGFLLIGPDEREAWEPVAVTGR